MSNLAKVLIFKIAATVLVWCIPLIFFPAAVLRLTNFPNLSTTLFFRLLGWAYLSLCVGYYFSLRAALQGKRLMGPIWVGIVSNGGAFVYLLISGLGGTWSAWNSFVQVVLWGSTLATALITLGLFMYGVRGDEPIIA